jgi:ABC-2 type transport system permease protein
MEVFFNDTKYLYDIFVILLRYLSAIFYNIDRFSDEIQRYFLINPVYAFIKYFRLIVIENRFPSLGYHALLLGYTVAALLIGGLIYKKNNRKFAFYL